MDLKVIKTIIEVNTSIFNIAYKYKHKYKRVLNRKPEPRMAPLITINMWKTIIGQSIYQTAVTLVLYFAGSRIFTYSAEEIGTIVFNTYVYVRFLCGFELAV
jgi:hypothetical protein